MTDAVAAIKNRRRAPKQGAAIPPPPAAPAESLAKAITRRNPALFDPAEMPVVMESSGFIPHADLSEYYLRAEVDGTEWVTPAGCRTPVARTLWLTGQHVRRDVYLTYLKEIGHELPEPYRQIVADSDQGDNTEEKADKGD